MEQDLANSVALLERFPGVLNALLRGLPQAWLDGNEGPGTFTAAEVVAHLLHAERMNWIPRIRMVLEKGETQTFRTFDREANEARNKPLPELLDDFAAARERALSELRELQLGEADLVKRGTHPVFGPVTLSELLAAWVAHDLTHLHQLARVLANQYRAAVGPFAAFLGVLQCQAHGRRP